ncbi:MAG: hypothetical protein M5U26_21430 [Planctomycetota bacterium]|nr:hypothetical protein [Planctomycetota bacterium]
MAYTLEAFVARKAIFGQAVLCNGMRIVALPQEFALIPFDDELCNAFPGATAALHVALCKLTPAAAEWAAALSRFGPVAYLEAEFFGGIGSQAAVVWQEKRVTLGPLHTQTVWKDGACSALPLREQAFNTALRLLGVNADGHPDEFDALGLGRHRRTEAWV